MAVNLVPFVPALFRRLYFRQKLRFVHECQEFAHAQSVCDRSIFASGFVPGCNKCLTIEYYKGVLIYGILDSELSILATRERYMADDKETPKQETTSVSPQTPPVDYRAELKPVAGWKTGTTKVLSALTMIGGAIYVAMGVVSLFTGRVPRQYMPPDLTLSDR